jgi:hypothetical protein
MKYLILFLIFLALLAWAAYRFRRQIAVARQVWKMLVDANKMRQQTGGAATPPQKIPAGKLVRCAKCETWTPEDTALKFGNNTYFCSPKCMEKAVVVNE